VKTQAATLDPMTEGWFNHGDQILTLIERYRPKVCVELGSWQGASAIPVARAIRRWGGTLTCVDTWGGDIHEAHGQPWMLVSCVRNMTQSGVSGNIRLIATSTRDAAAWWTEPIDYLYIDADHSYDGVEEDLRLWVPHVKPGGVIVGDDYEHPSFPGVKRAWDDFEQSHGLTLTRHQSSPANPCGMMIYGTL
jgi:predicted O-methyltransferase YrrM